MTYREALDYCAALQTGGIRLGLERLQNALAMKGDPHRRLRVVHVAGTNGKGSTARMIQCILTAAGYRVGMFSSPAVTDVCDTVTLDGVGVSHERFAALITEWAAVQNALGEEGALTEFELLTAAALTFFAEERVDICVLECGMGGRLDATNVCPPPLAAVFAPIARDHAAFLGDTVEEIAFQKSGIIKAPCAVVTSPAQSPDVLAVLYEAAAEQGLSVYMPSRGAVTVLDSRLGETRFMSDDTVYTVPLGGEFQVDNALTALETVRVLATRGFAVSAEHCRNGLAAASLPCRQEVICRAPLIVLDGAHNPHGVAQTAEELRRMTAVFGARPILLYGMLRDKDTAACAALLAPLAEAVVCCTPPSERALEAAQLAEQFAAAGTRAVHTAASVEQAWEMARSLAGDKPLFVGGSFYTASAIRPFALAFAAACDNN
ncbi:MAG: bifunctional folylpolyglutamate synthase/dihydrofolate synthase [Ruminococcaceae bacterium]|nr:bifunctional folylpolyglutamate synthase/dihydrofolate synthase [Oscillospiraceae bacterium]